MPTISALADGFEAREESSAWPGQWLEEGTATAGLTVGGTYIPKPDQNLTGFFIGFDWRYKSAIKFGPINVAQGQGLSQFDVTLKLSEARKSLALRIQAVLDSTVDLGVSTLPSNQQLTTAQVSINTSTFTDYNAFDYWTLNNPLVTLNLLPVAQEVINDANWASGNSIWFVIDIVAGQVPGSNGHLYYYSIEHPSEPGASLIYDSVSVPVLTSISTDDDIEAGETDVAVVGTNLDSVSSIRIVSGATTYNQTILSKTSTLIQFNMSGSIPLGAATFEAVYSGGTATRPIDIIAAQAQGTPASTTIDGFEWTNSTFPGTWISKSQDEATFNSFSNQIVMSRYFTANACKASFKIGPIAINRGASIGNFSLLLNVANAFADVTLNVKAVADPLAADIGASNIITGQTLTTAERVESTANWAGQNAGGSWVPTTNPYPINVTSVAQEVINHANWPTNGGGYIQFVVDFAELGGNTGWIQAWSRESATNASTSVSFTLGTNTTIVSVSGDNTVLTDETDIAIVGTNFGSITNFTISKGGISQAQTVKTQTTELITFDLSLGSIVADTGYTLSFDSDGTTVSTTINVEVGGTVAGDAIPNLDGHEYSIAGGPAPTPGGTAGTYEGQTSAASSTDFMNTAVVVGRTPFNIYMSCHLRFPNINANQGQGFTTCKLVIPPVASTFNLWKVMDVDIYGIKDSTAAAIGAANKISDIAPSALTTATASFSTWDWTGFNTATYWQNIEEEVDITAVVSEIVADSNWVNGNDIQLILVPTGFPAGSGHLGLASTENGTDAKIVFDYVAASNTNIASVNGNNIVQDNDTGIIISGASLTGATALTIFKGARSQAQTILTNTDDQITFDFVRGTLGYGSSYTLRVTVGSLNFDRTIAIHPEDGLDFVETVGSMTGNNSIGFDASPEYVAGDVLVYQNTSASGFPVTISDKWVPTITSSQTGSDSFTVRAWDSQTGTHETTLSTITFEGNDYLSKNPIPIYDFGAPVALPLDYIEPEIEAPQSLEAWSDVAINEDLEDWTDV